MLELLKRHVLSAEERVMKSVDREVNRIAVLDLDGTLLMGDIGDAVFAFLLLEGYKLSLSWGEYQRLLRTHKSRAYRAIVESMAGLDVETIERATSTVMNLTKDHLMIDSYLVCKPKPRPLLVEFVAFLHDFHYQVYVISASNHISVQYVAQTCCNIPPSFAFGIQSEILNDRTTSNLINPIPVGPGKAELFKLVCASPNPLITATDSPLDLPLIRLTHPEGFSLWAGNDSIDYDSAKENARPGQRFIFVGSGEETPLDEF